MLERAPASNDKQCCPLISAGVSVSLGLHLHTTWSRGPFPLTQVQNVHVSWEFSHHLRSTYNPHRPYLLVKNNTTTFPTALLAQSSCEF